MNHSLKNIKEGDSIIVNSNRYGDKSSEQRTVTRVTPTQIVVGQERFSRKDGFQIGTTGYFAQKKWLSK